MAITKQEEKFTRELNKLEDTISKNRSEIVTKIKCKVDKNKLDIQHVMNENKHLCKENSSLKERMSRMEAAQLCNNVIITGILEQQWEPYDATKQHVIDNIAASFKSNNDTEREENKSKAQNSNTAYCTWVGRYQPNQCQPISVTFQKREDKDQLMSGKSNLPSG